MAVFNQGGGGGRAGGTDPEDAFAFDQPYEISSQFTAETANQINEMFKILFKSLKRGETKIEEVDARIDDIDESDTTDLLPIDRMWAIWAVADTTTSDVIGVGITNPSHNVLSNNADNFGGIPYSQIGVAANTSATLASISRSGTDSSVPDRAALQKVYFRIRTGPSIASPMRMWIGVSNDGNDLTVGQDTTPAPDFALFRFSTTASDSNWQGVVRDNSTTTVVDTGVVVTVDTVYTLSLEITASNVIFTVNETAVTVSALPRSGQPLYAIVQLEKDITGGAEQRYMWFHRMAYVCGVNSFD